jgi:hypothetical protein
MEEAERIAQTKASEVSNVYEKTDALPERPIVRQTRPATFPEKLRASKPLSLPEQLRSREKPKDLPQ